jgi:undecaprenyl-diphosphatase
MIDWIEALVLGVVQGATEYLPVSSSGHLVIFQHLFGLTEPALLFDIVLHVATLLVVLWFYRRDIVELLRQSAAAISELARGGQWSDTQAKLPGFRLAILIVVGTIPTALIGVTLQDTFEVLFGSLWTVGVMLWVTGLILLATRLATRGDRGVGAMKWGDALLIGLVQGLAITPGISRSGSTIAVALLLGIQRETAARYSFLLSVPSIIGALVLKLGDAGGGVGLTATALGFAAALLTGYFCLVFLVRLVKKGRLAWFAPYCFLVGLLAVILASLQSQP